MSDFQETLMGIGRFTLDLRAPRRVIDELGGYDTICVFPAIIPPFTDPATAKALACFTGMIDDIDEGETCRVTGPSNAAWLGKASNIGPPGVGINWVKTDDVDVVLLALFLSGTATNGFELGTTAGVPSVDINFLKGDQPELWIRDTLDEVASKHGVEWRAMPNFTVDLAPADEAAVWVQDPEVIICSTLVGQDFRYHVLRGGISGGTTHQDQVNTLWVTGHEGGSSTAVQTDRATMVKQPGDFTTDADLWKFHDVAGTSGVAAQGADLIDSVYDEHDAVQVTVDCWDSTGLFNIGDNLGVYAPERGVLDIDNPKVVLGLDTFPRVARCRSRTQPIRRGMATWALANDGGGALDLTDYVQPGAGPVRLDLGWRRPSTRERLVTRQRRR